MNIGRRIYTDKKTGTLIQDTGERSGDVVETTIDHDFEVYTSLAERVRDTVGVIELEYGDYAQDFQTGRLHGIDPVTKALIFSYPDPQTPGEETPPQPALTVQLAALAVENAELKTMIEDKDRENKNALFEIYSILLGGE